MPIASPRLLFLLPPGRQARFYIIGLINAAKKLEVPYLVTDLAPVWAHLGSAAANQPSAFADIQLQFAALVRKEKFTHAVGYAFSGADLGRVQITASESAPLFAALGLTHLMLWTDHPNWCANGAALDPLPRSSLSHPRHIHFLKSESAAAEAAAVLGWPNVHHLPMAEDYDLLPPASGVEPIHDVVALVGDAGQIPPALAPFLADDNADPAALDAVTAPAALSSFLKRATVGAGAQHEDALRQLGEWLLAVRRSTPLDSFWRLAADAPPELSVALAHLKSDPRLWFESTAALRRMIDWRRNFWLAWLARRVNLGLYGSDASRLGVQQVAGDSSWVNYSDQPAIYARGRCAININASHDEEGCTHKPFQIAAAKVPCIHHSSRGLSELFTTTEPSPELLTFTTGQELLAAVRSITHNPSRRNQLAEAMHARARADHTWTNRLTAMLERSV